MIPEENLKISFMELSLRGAKILAQQPEISFSAALQQIQWLRKNSKVQQSSKKNKNAS